MEVDWLSEDDWDKVEGACDLGRWHLHDRMDPAKGVWVMQVCSRPWCGRCEPVRNFKLVRQIQQHIEWYEEMATRGAPKPHWRFITMSTKNSSTLEGAFALEKWAWQRFRSAASMRAKRGKAHPWSEVLTWVGFREVTLGDAGFNLHRHLLVGTARSYWDWKQMHAMWDMACGDGGGQFHQSEATVKVAAAYAAKYAAKGGVFWGGLSQLEAYRFRGGLKGKNRLVRAVGSKPPKEPAVYQLCCNPVTAGDCDWI